MSEDKSKGNEIPNELIQAERLVEEGKHEDVLKIMKKFEEGNLHDTTLCNLLKCEILLQQGLLKNVIKLAEKTYKESLGLGKNFLSVDALTLMALALISEDKMEEGYTSLKQGEELLKTIKQESSANFKQREANISYVKGWFYYFKHDSDRALEHYEHSLALGEETDSKPQVASSLLRIAWVHAYQKGDMNRAFPYAERGLALAKESNHKHTIARASFVMATLFLNKGELDRSIIFYEQSLAINKELNNKARMADTLNALGGLYRVRGELDRALECLEESLALSHESGDIWTRANIHDYLIQVLIDMGDLERAQRYLHELKDLKTQFKTKKPTFYRMFNIMYLFNRALLLKTSPRARNRVEAEEILKKILENKDLDHEVIVGVLLNLCDLLLIELGVTNDIDVLIEITPLITQLLDISEKSNSNLILCETHLLQAKISLLTLDLKSARRFLTQAQQIAERCGFNQLAEEISNEQADLNLQLSTWRDLEETNAPLTERMKLARVEDQMKGMLRNRMLLTAQITEEKVSVHKEKKVCLVCRGEVERFNIFICPECNTIYCQNCARALTDLENICWGCNTPIDPSKPINPYDKEEEEGKISSGEDFKTPKK